ncbi:FtsX-like permease family protein [Streptomyces sp. NBC_01498]|uniref:FtsX-like permease family protein n=1 Tax=Streptomyces sp. NBC_01498 TaxID=2975870 RepID=UPI002E7BD7C6|nr:FtsX-like permease family protein [Streptomyces sp. NBC_01498]WTL25953.1 FtsX-like permease family protein [Streptomyces sp. NBC_01498]
MRTWYHSWRAAIRIARRDAWRFKGRSFLVLAMLALPILGVSAADLTLRSAELSPAEKLTRELGHADARVDDPKLGGAALLQLPDGTSLVPEGDYGDKPWPQGDTDVLAALPEGTRSLEDARGTAKLRTVHGLLNSEIRELDAADPMAEGIMHLDRGRFPRTANEVAATTAFLEASGLHVGSKLTARGLDTEYRIVGAYELPDNLDEAQVNALPGALLDPLGTALAAAELPDTRKSVTHLVTTSGDAGFTWNMVMKANKKGITVASRAVILDPPADSDVPYFQQQGASAGEKGPRYTTALAAAATVVALMMLEICLLAGPAFAVGARRSRRQLGLVGANGGDRHHIRAIVLSGGLVIGVVAAVVGTTLGVALTFLLRPVLEDWLGVRFGGFDVRPLELAGIALLAVITGLLAAIVPAVTASRQTVVASLTGRQGVRRSSRVLPAVGLVAVVLGAGIALYGSAVSDQVLLVGGGSALAELGVVALTPALVGLFGRIGHWLPLSPRLALRDAVRNRGRTAPAVAAVLAAVAGTVAVATYTASSEAQERARYEASLPYGAVAILSPESAADVPAIRDDVQRLLPTGIRADVDRVVVGKGNCSAYGGNDECGRYEVVVPKAHECPLWQYSGTGDPAEKFSVAERRKLAYDWRCAQGDNGAGSYGGEIVIGDEKLLTVLGIKDPEAREALANGQAVSFSKRNVAPAASAAATASGTGGARSGTPAAAADRTGGSGGSGGSDGTISIRVIEAADMEAADQAGAEGKEPPGTVTSIPAHQAPDDERAYGITMIVPADAARKAGLTTVPFGAFYTTRQVPSSAEEQQVFAEIDKTGSDAQLIIENGFTPENGATLLALAVFAGLITIGAAGIATGLAQADAEPDLKTLAAVGAPPRVRKALSGFQCGVVAAMGVVLGSASGILPAIGLRFTERRAEEGRFQRLLDDGYAGGGGDVTAPFVPVVIPWETLGLLLIAVPLGAALLAALVTRSRGALTRRAAI